MDEEEKKKLKELKEAIKKVNGLARDLMLSEEGSEVPESRIKNAKWHQLVYHPVSMLQLSMPHKEQKNIVEWHVRNGESELFLSSGMIKNKKGLREPTGLPCSRFARYILLWVIYTVQIKKKRSIFLGHTESQILSKMEREGRRNDDYHNLRQQMSRLFRCSLEINMDYPEIDLGIENHFPFQGEGEYTEYQRFAGNIASFENKNNSESSETDGHKPDNRGYFINLSEELYNSIMNKPLPIDFNHVKQLAKGGNSIKLDIYTFLAERLHEIPADKPLLIERQDIEDLFGVNVSDKGKFYRDTFKSALIEVMEVYREANVEFVLKAGIVLHHSPPPYLDNKSESISQLPYSSDES